MSRETTPGASTKSSRDRLAALTARFGEEAETFYLNVEGDFVIGIVKSVGSMTTQHGSAPYVDFELVEGDSEETEDVTVGKRYRLAFLGTVMKGRFDPTTFVPGVRFVAMNRGKKATKSGGQEYNNIDVQVLPAE